MNLEGIFAEIKKRILKKQGYKDEIALFINSHSGVSVEPANIKIQNYKIYLDISNMDKMQVAMKKNKILHSIKSNFNEEYLDIV